MSTSTGLASSGVPLFLPLSASSIVTFPAASSHFVGRSTAAPFLVGRPRFLFSVVSGFAVSFPSESFAGRVEVLFNFRGASEVPARLLAEPLDALDFFGCGSSAVAVALDFWARFLSGSPFDNASSVLLRSSTGLRDTTDRMSGVMRRASLPGLELRAYRMRGLPRRASAPELELRAYRMRGLPRRASAPELELRAYRMRNLPRRASPPGLELRAYRMRGLPRRASPPGLELRAYRMRGLPRRASSPELELRAYRMRGLLRRSRMDGAWLDQAYRTRELTRLGSSNGRKLWGYRLRREMTVAP